MLYNTFYTSPWEGFAVVESLGNMYEIVDDGWGGISALPLSEEQIEDSGENMLEMDGEISNGEWISTDYCLSFNLEKVKEAIERVNKN